MTDAGDVAREDATERDAQDLRQNRPALQVEIVGNQEIDGRQIEPGTSDRLQDDPPGEGEIGGNQLVVTHRRIPVSAARNLTDCQDAIRCRAARDHRRTGAVGHQVVDNLALRVAWKTIGGHAKHVIHVGLRSD